MSTSVGFDEYTKAPRVDELSTRCLVWAIYQEEIGLERPHQTRDLLSKDLRLAAKAGHRVGLLLPERPSNDRAARSEPLLMRCSRQEDEADLWSLDVGLVTQTLEIARSHARAPRVTSQA